MLGKSYVVLAATEEMNIAYLNDPYEDLDDAIDDYMSFFQELEIFPIPEYKVYEITINEIKGE